MDWSAIVSPVASLAGGIFGMNSARSAAQKAAELQFEYQKDLNKQANAYNVENYQHRYTWSVDDMRRAGLNPILAATQGISGSVAGASSGQAGLAQPQTPDFGSLLGNAFNSAYQTKSQKEIARMQNEVAKGELKLKEMDINSAIEKRQNDQRLANLGYELEKWKADQENRRADMMTDAKIKNMVDTLEATIAHYERMDANDAVKASAALRQADASGLMAAIQYELGLSNIEVNKAREAFIGLQSSNEQEQLEWQHYLNDHKEVRGAVGLLGSFFDTAGLALKSEAMLKTLGGID